MRSTICALLALLLTVNCTNNIEVDTNQFDNGSPQIIRAQFGDEPVRMFVDNAKLYWHQGDEISLFPKRSDNLEYSYSGESGTVSASFNKVTNTALSGSVLERNYALYPYSKTATVASEGVINCTLPSTQSYAANSFGMTANTMVAVSDDNTFAFKNAVGYIEIKLYGKDFTVRSITLSGNKSEKIAGTAAITCGAEPQVVMADGATKSITVDCGAGVKIGQTAATATSFWFAIPETTFTQGINITITDSAGKSCKKTTTKSVAVTRSTVQPMAAFEVATEAKTGAVLPPWSEGYLDIHFINSGRGECCFYILPDGTTLLVDAGEVVATYKATATGANAAVQQKPNTSTRPYMVYAKYIKHFMPEGRTKLNWCAPSHFHIDHIGEPDAATESANGYRKAGLIALFDEVPFHRVIDRAYPDYEEDSETPVMEGALSADWVKFVEYQLEQGNIGKGYRFTPGKEQITLCYNKAGYSNFRLFNICANGFAWNMDSNGEGYLAGEKSDAGNPASCGFHIKYGNFDYVACGDLTSAPQNLMANYVASFIGNGNFEAFKTNHHLSSNSWGTNMRKNTFTPRVIANLNFYKKQPDPDLLDMILDYSWSKDFFTTNLHPTWTSWTDADYTTLLGKITDYNGHIVIRVAPGGGSYYVYLLDDTNFEYKIKSIHGPYTSK